MKYHSITHLTTSIVRFFTTLLFFTLFIKTPFSVVYAQNDAISNTPSSSKSTANKYESMVVLWQGFSHHWTYNHRLNRLGSGIINQQFDELPYQAQLQHTAATGIGADVGKYESYYAYLAMNGIVAQSGEQEMKFTGKEGKFHRITQSITIDAGEKMADKQQYVVVLNGFDLRSEQKADKLRLFRLAVSDGEYLPATQQIRFEIDVALLVHCRSIECSRFTNKFNYSLTAQYLILAANEEALHTSEKVSQHTYEWNKDLELTHVNQQETIKGSGKGNYPNAVLAFKALNIHLDRDHWLLDWHTAIHPEKYDAQKGTYQYGADLLFKQWNAQMKKASANPKKSRFAMKRNGWATLDATVVLLQFKDAKVIHDQTKGIVKWNGKNEKANSDKAISLHPLVFDENMLQTDLSALRAKRKAETEQVNLLYNQYVLELEQAKKLRKEDKRKERTEKKIDKQIRKDIKKEWKKKF